MTRMATALAPLVKGPRIFSLIFLREIRGEAVGGEREGEREKEGGEEKETLVGLCFGSLRHAVEPQDDSLCGSICTNVDAQERGCTILYHAPIPSRAPCTEVPPTTIVANGGSLCVAATQCLLSCVIYAATFLNVDLLTCTSSGSRRWRQRGRRYATCPSGHKPRC